MQKKTALQFVTMANSKGIYEYEDLVISAANVEKVISEFQLDKMSENELGQWLAEMELALDGMLSSDMGTLVL